MNNTQKRIEKQQAKQKEDMQNWWGEYWQRLEQYNEPQRIAHRKEINEYLEQVGKHFNLR